MYYTAPDLWTMCRLQAKCLPDSIIHGSLYSDGCAADATSPDGRAACSLQQDSVWNVVL